MNNKKIIIIVAIILAIILILIGWRLIASNNKDMAEPMVEEEQMADKDMDKDMTDDSMDQEKEDMADESMDKEKEDMTDESMDKEDMDKEDEMSDDEMMEDNFLNVTMMDVDGNEWNLAKLGDKAVVKVWASWCSICLSGMDELNEFSGQYTGAKVLTVVTPGMFGEKNKEDFIEWYKGLENVENIVVIIDEEGLLIKTLGIRGFPTYVYIDSNGNYKSMAIGHQSSDAVVNRLDEIQ